MLVILLADVICANHCGFPVCQNIWVASHIEFVTHTNSRLALGVRRLKADMTATIYGIKNCDTMKKAFGWLAEQGIDVEFHDYKKTGIDATHLERWCNAVGWEKILNRAGMTFRKLDDADKQELNREKAIRLMLARPPMIKRPVLEVDGRIVVGFKPELYAGFFAQNRLP